MICSTFGKYSSIHVGMPHSLNKLHLAMTLCLSLLWIQCDCRKPDKRRDRGDVVTQQISNQSKLLTGLAQAIQNGVKVNVNATDHLGNSYLHVAASEGHLEVLQGLMLQGADINATNHVGRTPLHLAALKKGNLAIVQVLIANGANVKAIDNDGYTPLNHAVNALDTEMMGAISERLKKP